MYNYGIERERSKKSDDDNGGFQQQSPQRLFDGYKHMSGRNDRWIMRLNVIPLA